MRTLLLMALLGAATPSPAAKTDPLPPVAPVAPAPPAASPAPSLDQRIADLNNARDPFWPPGYKSGGKTETKVEEPTDDLDLLALREGSKLNVQGRIKVGNRFLLMLKGRAVGQGDIIDVTGKNGKSHKMRIVSISQDNIQLEPVGR